ncbi:MAG TPA: alpha/beta hydrolase [Streptosporangiaceae bacterium]|jgi:pimeloyl-ACP methyl ester carboxylesterase
MPYADLGDVTLFYTDDAPAGGGPGAPLLLVHGWGADSHEWNAHIPHLAAARRVIAVDLRGHGYSSVPAGGYTIRGLAGDLVRLLARLGVERVVAVGHSMGGQVVSVLAVEWPRLVEAVVTVEPGYGQPPELVPYPDLVAALRGADGPAAAVAIDAWDYTPASPAALRTWHNRRLLAMPPRVLAELFAAMFTANGQFGLRPESDAHLKRRTCPSLSFWFDPAQADWERPLLAHPDSAVVAWPGSGHRLHEERPAEFLLVLDRWLTTISHNEVNPQ